jgi:hypothetical protein
VDGVTTGLTFDVPDGWYRWDPADPVGGASKELDARIQERPALAPVRQTLLRLLIDFWDDAADQQAVAAAALVEPAPDAALVASVVVVEAERDHPGDEEAEIAALLSLLRADSPFDIRPRTVDTVDLPVGRAVRLGRLARTDGADPGETEVVVEMVQHWLPVPGEATMVVLAGSSPCLHAADELALAFDSIARSVAFQTVAGRGRHEPG